MAFDPSDWEDSSNDAKTATDYITDDGAELFFADKDGVGYGLVLDYENGAILIEDESGNVVGRFSASVILGREAGRHMVLDSGALRFMDGLIELMRLFAGSSTTSHQAFMGSNASQMFLYGGTAAAPKGVYLAAPPSVSSGGGIVASDQGVGLVFNDPSHPTWAHVYISTADGFGNLADWVVSHGIEGMWRWQKWASGKAECWGWRTSEQSIEVDTLWDAGIYESSGLYDNLPTGLFNDKPLCYPIFDCSGGRSIMGIEPSGSATQYRTQNAHLLRPNISTVTGLLGWKCTGTWK